MTSRPDWRAIVAGLAIALLLVAIGAFLRGGGQTDPLLGSQDAGQLMRRPDLFGVVVAVDAATVTLQDGTVLALTTSSRVVSSYTQQPVVLRARHFVHVGLQDGAADWIAVLGVVPQAPPGLVVYTGTAHVQDGEVVFDDGTVLPLAEGVQLYPGHAIVHIEPDSGFVVGAEQDLITPEG